MKKNKRPVMIIRKCGGREEGGEPRSYYQGERVYLAKHLAKAFCCAGHAVPISRKEADRAIKKRGEEEKLMREIANAFKT